MKILPGVTYLKWSCFSINEGEFPNIHISWYPYFFFYIAWKWKSYGHKRFYLNKKWTAEKVLIDNH